MNAQRLLILAMLLLLWTTPGVADDDPTVLSAWRAARRAQVRERSLAHAAAKVLADPRTAVPRFGLLVIPVDFADRRLPDDWDAAGLAPRLGNDGGQSLRHYFDIASAGRCELVPVVAPLVRLSGAIRDYSDVGYNGFSRSRRLARDAIAAIADGGFPLRQADLDGPDGLPGTDDDDGWVDGVLILHAEVGQENDPATGLIQALQYYLDVPVTADGVGATAYAVASLESGPGIWAHETAHLLGMEDRYDPLLPPDGGAGDLAGAGGLGRFSLMAAGALGTGGGWNPALPDAYSRALLGWCDVVPVVTGAAAGDTLLAAPLGSVAHRVWTRGESGPEFFLLETRDPAGASPFDAAVPPGLVVLHVDENVPDGSWLEDGFQSWHLRARLVEADGGDELRTGQDAGGGADVFPGTGANTALTPVTQPSSDGYVAPSDVSITGIALVPGGGVHRIASGSAPWLTFDVGFDGTGPQHALQLTARTQGGPVSTLTLEVRALGDRPWGSFMGGALNVSVDMVEGADGLWRPGPPVIWESENGLPPDVHTNFRYTLSGPDVATAVSERPWHWSWLSLALDFARSWPGGWVAEQPDGGGTSWRRWTGADSPASGQVPVLACTGDAVAPSAWPAVAYTNGGRARLTSGPLPTGTAAVRLLHWVDVERLPDGTPMDGATVVWVGPDGAETAAAPTGGWPARVADSSGSALRGRGAFGEVPGELDEADQPVWRTDLFPLPGSGPGPWRLRLEFAANELWRGRGWLVGACEAVAAPLEVHDPALRWQAGLLWNWTWPAPDPSPRFDVQARVAPDSTWTTILTDVRQPVPSSVILPHLGGPATTRHELRVTGPTLWGTLALSPVRVYVDGGATSEPVLGAPWPNPAAGDVRFVLRVAEGAAARLLVYDVRGRLVHARAVPPGEQFARWDGRDGEGRRLPSGTYVLKLEGAGAPVTRKVVLTH